MPYEARCKLCKFSKVEEIEFMRYFLGWSYKLIVEFYEDDIELSGYNLSNHFNRHTERRIENFWRKVKEAEAQTSSD
ncbi:hypothetical protein MUP77_24745 [Candidatus Bathyarchaeota archaeon]|nr:hypothetical protein [Candidatus Bathyarchaeota archaeon]